MVERTYNQPARLNPNTGLWGSDEYTPPISGGTSAFAWSSPSPLADGGEITITSDTYTFTSPDGLVYIGFGAGWMQSATEGSPLVDHIAYSATGAGSVDYEYTPGLSNRFVYTESGIKFLRSEMYYPSSGNRFNAGFINWDTGSNLAPGEFIYQFNTSRLTKNSGVQNNFQWKGERNAQYANLPPGDEPNANSIYLKLFGGGMVLDAYLGAPTNSSEYYCTNSAPNQAGQLYNFGWSSVQNTPDLSDGFNGVHSARSDKTYTRVVPPGTYANGYQPANNCTKSTFATRTRFAKIQDYIGNVTDASEIEILRTDIYMQRNGSVFILANSTNLDAATHFVPLVPTQFNNSSSWKFRLWKGTLPSYDGAGIFLLDKFLNVVASAAL